MPQEKAANGEKVRLTGLEPARRETLDPKSSASTNSATGAMLFSFRLQRYEKN